MTAETTTETPAGTGADTGIHTDAAALRRQAVDAALADVRQLLQAGAPDRSTLSAITARLEQLAAHKALFSRADFPARADRGRGRLHALPPQPGRWRCGPGLYLNSINPGKTTAPHNHTTWAVIVAVEGQELNRLYERTDDRSDPARASIHLAREPPCSRAPPSPSCPMTSTALPWWASSPRCTSISTANRWKP